MTKAVALVLDPQFGDRIDELARRMPVWILSDPANSQAVARARAAGASITTFDRRPNESTQDLLLRAAYNIEDHHGTGTGSASYDTLEVHGMPAASCPPHIQADLGLKIVTDAQWGVVARKL